MKSSTMLQRILKTSFWLRLRYTHLLATFYGIIRAHIVASFSHPLRWISALFYWISFCAHGNVKGEKGFKSMLCNHEIRSQVNEHHCTTFPIQHNAFSMKIRIAFFYMFLSLFTASRIFCFHKHVSEKKERKRFIDTPEKDVVQPTHSRVLWTVWLEFPSHTQIREKIILLSCERLD